MSVACPASAPWSPAPGSPQDRALAHVAARSDGAPIDASLRVTLNFHPDRAERGMPILEALARDGVYRSQFETGTSNGGLTAHPGGDRWRWESRIFGAAYDDAPAAERPKYGALDHRRRATGGSPRFGSAHLRLRAEVLARTTFCYPDSVFDPVHFGVAARMGLVAHAQADCRDALDDYIEAHVHGPLVLARDVEALVLDPCYRGTQVEALARALPCSVEWHAGFRLHVDALSRYPDYRGPEPVSLALAIAREGWLTPAIIGDAASTGEHDPQCLKKVWHYVARFGDLGQQAAAGGDNA
ncbi:DUF3626 domain-containing protein [Cupriavidus respiraculi]|uniref:DUF3626 domain-containing protein n=1 Tax=Cupriavidus respiraculi TaxID=195930 RepID=A0ABN7Y9H9_9BURK|nr:DUF3626 domain-containing protein [Cupriavidus respiraculi]CAG9168645.1 hypothetical protein LMG21510_01174 [Cupriavidus respiraculi]